MESNSRLCRVCSDTGHYDLSEMKFCCNDTDVLLIEAFNAFSELKNVSVHSNCLYDKHFKQIYFSFQETTEVYLCEVCTESLTLSYSFWQQIKLSDVNFMKETATHKVKTEQRIEIVEADDDDEEEYINSEHSIGSDDTSPKNEPVKRKIRKAKLKTNYTIEESDKKIGVNIALPHFVIANNDSDENEDTIESRIKTEMHAMSDCEPQRKQVKTLKPSVQIPADLNQINELCLSPMEIDSDVESIYKCSHCPKAFAAPHHLMIHLRKSHLCQYCLATFSKINDLYSHVKETHRTFDCLLCSKEFQSNGNLRQHMRKNHGIFLPAHISLLNISDVSQ